MVGGLKRGRPGVETSTWAPGNAAFSQDFDFAYLCGAPTCLQGCASSSLTTRWVKTSKLGGKCWKDGNSLTSEVGIQGVWPHLWGWLYQVSGYLRPGVARGLSSRADRLLGVISKKHQKVRPKRGPSFWLSFSAGPVKSDCQLRCRSTQRQTRA